MTRKEIAVAEEKMTKLIRYIENMDFTKDRSPEAARMELRRYDECNSQLKGMEQIIYAMGYAPKYHFAEEKPNGESLSYYKITRLGEYK